MKRYVSCSWIDDAGGVQWVAVRQDAQCKKEEVKNACKRACGECCGDNPNHQFMVNDENSDTRIKVSCSWLRGNENRRKEYCQIKRLSCPYSCGLCPTMSPSNIPTVNPSTTVIPSDFPSRRASNEPSITLSMVPSTAPSMTISGYPSTSPINYPSWKPSEDTPLVTLSGQKQSDFEGVASPSGFFQTFNIPILIALSVFGVLAFALLLVVRKRRKNAEEIAGMNYSTSGEDSTDQDHLVQPKWCEVWPISSDFDPDTALNFHTDTAFKRVHSTISEAAMNFRTDTAFTRVHSTVSEAACTVSNKLTSITSMIKSKAYDLRRIDDSNVSNVQPSTIGDEPNLSVSNCSSDGTYL